MGKWGRPTGETSAWVPRALAPRVAGFAVGRAGKHGGADRSECTGCLKNAGMASFAPALDHEKAAQIRAYVIHRATLDKRTGESGVDIP